MFDRSFSVNVFFPQVQIPHKAYISNAESSRRIEEFNNYEESTPKMTKNKKSNHLKIIRNTNASFSTRNNVVFCFRKNYVMKIRY